MSNVVLLIEKDLDSLDVLIELFVDAEGLIVELVLIILSNLSQFNTIKVIKSVNIVHDLGVIGLDSSENKQILKVLVVSESGVVEDDSLKELN